ncbi:hypothetical protein PCL_07449 [Purpureocillium lilacinum]|uniref:Uncharacterized protein n=1 Tax=Purpureocillium lilacinum TaxID=33203 RepID=A0A2U3DS10_PURLI|nr:hypothetical protein PCL_07449 [Purpureocillium lilacinum]
MSRSAPDICETLNLTSDGLPRCRTFAGPRDSILDYADHVRSRLTNEKRMDFNTVVTRLFDSGELRQDVFKQMLEESAGICTWDCCYSSTPLWDLETPQVKAYFVKGQVAAHNKKRVVMRALQLFPWPAVQEALQNAHVRRVSGNSRGSAKGRLTPVDFLAALQHLQGETGGTPSRTSPGKPATRSVPRDFLQASSAPTNSTSTGRHAEYGSKSGFMPPDSASRASPARQRSVRRRSGTQVASIAKCLRQRESTVTQHHDQGQPRKRRAASASPCPSVIMIPGSPTSEESVSNQESHASSPTPQPYVKRPRRARPFTDGVDEALESWLESLVLGHLLGPDFVFQALECICDFAAGFEAAKPGSTITYESLAENVTRLVPVKVSNDHWILGRVRHGCPVILYDPKGSCDSTAGLDRVRIVPGGRFYRSSPVFQQNEGESEVLLLYIALCLVGQSDIPPTVDMSFCRHLLHSVLHTDSLEEASGAARVRLDIQRLLNPIIVDSSTWGRAGVRLSDVREALERIREAEEAMRSDLALMLPSAHHTAALFEKLIASYSGAPTPSSFRIRIGLEFCDRVKDGIHGK